MGSQEADRLDDFTCEVTIHMWEPLIIAVGQLCHRSQRQFESLSPVSHNVTLFGNKRSIKFKTRS